jgi:microsomal dipeptidase-like Zn-dependent dipeptidase
MARDFADRVGIAATPEEFRRIVAAGKFAVVLSFQNALTLAQEIGSIDAWIDRGVRMFGFAFIGNNPWADSARPYPYIAAGTRSDGLSALGRAGVRRLKERGVIVDVSQLSTAALDQVLAISSAPVVASHSALRAFVDTGRNLSDLECVNIRNGGGLVQVVGFAPYLRPLDAAMMAELRALWQRFGLAPPDSIGAALSVDDPQTETWEDDKFWTFLHEFHDVLALHKPIAEVRHLGAAIDHAVDVMGIGHVGIASDFNHSGGLADWYDVGQSLNVTAELIRRGYAESYIAKLWGENFLRIWQRTQDMAA